MCDVNESVAHNIRNKSTQHYFLKNEKNTPVDPTGGSQNQAIPDS